MSSTPAWERRFTTPRIATARSAWSVPSRIAVVSNQDGTWQAWSWNLGSGARVRISDLEIGVERAEITPDGSAIVWWDDPTGDERGRWVATPFEGGRAVPLLPEVPTGWDNGLSMTSGGTAIGVVTDEGYRVFASTNRGPAREVYRHPVPAGQSDELHLRRLVLSEDATLLVTRTAERGDIELTSLRVLEPATGETVADLDDATTRLVPIAWSPIPGDQRLLFLHERTGWEAPGIWDLTVGERTDLVSGLEGASIPLGWFPDGASILVLQQHGDRDRLVRLDVPDGAATLVIDRGGAIDDAHVRGNGEVWALVHSSVDPPTWVTDDGQEILRLGEAPPPGRPSTSFWFANPSGHHVQSLVLAPETLRDGPPFPTIVSVHGGPGWRDRNAYDPARLAYADHGYAVLEVNYRGSTGYGTAFRDAIRGDLGFAESEDLIAALDRAIADGLADPDRVFLEGWSWGGYLGLLNAGLHPERWRAVCAGVPGGDWVVGHFEASPEMRAWEEMMLGGDPLEVPLVYHERNPTTYTHLVQAPIMIIAGEHDVRSTFGATMAYVHALLVAGKTVELHRFAAGHHANAAAEQVEHVRLTMDFFARNGGVPIA